ncbi:adenosylhomocysteinase [Candidatus Gottesmanbacteria bacterium]|nr:adenosylhomocysteinase [Candidatus Gottesmanbacteria bacterium]
MNANSIDLSLPRVILHNLTLKGIEVVPGVLDFDQRGILFARPGDVVITKRPPEKAFLQYLTNLGWDFSGVSFLSPKSLQNYTYRSIFYDKDLLSALQKIDLGYIDVYQNTVEEHLFGKRAGLPLYANPMIGQEYGTKSGFRRLAKKIKLSIPRGYESVKTPQVVLKKVHALFASGASRVIIKIDEGLSGAGQTLINKEEFFSLSKKEQNHFVTAAIQKIPQFGKQSAATVEEWVEGAIASPSIQLEVRPDKTVHVVSMKDQLLEGVEKWYIGCSYPVSSLTEKQKIQFEKEARQFTEVLAHKGYIGFLGMDAILFPDGSFLWVEANVRKPGTFYPRIIAEKLNGGTLRNTYYVACDFTIPKLKGTSCTDVHSLLRSYLYPIVGKKRGVVVYNTGALLDAGRFDLICIGESAEDAKDLFRQVKHLLDVQKQEGGPMKTTLVPHYVRDLALAKQGKQMIDWADNQMPVLKLIRTRFAKEKPLKGIKIDLSCHLTVATANLARTLVAGGATVLAHSGNPVSTQDDVCASLVVDYGIMTFGARNIDREINKENVAFAIDQEPDIAIDDGAEFISVMYKKYPDRAKKMLGGTEETTTGLHRLRSLEAAGLLKFPIIGVNDAQTKHFFDNRYGTGQSTIDGILRATNLLLAGKVFVVVGYGWCGKGVAMRAKGMGSDVVVCETDAVKALEAVMDGYRVMPINAACKIADFLITVTGDMHAVDLDDLKVLKSGVVIGNSGHFNVEINLIELDKLTKTKTRVRPSLDEYLLKDGRKIYLVGEGRLANLAAAEGHPSEVMDMSFANQALAAEYLVKNKGKLDNKVYDVPREIDEWIARLKLKAMGVAIDTLTKEQDQYLHQWEKGGYGLI